MLCVTPMDRSLAVKKANSPSLFRDVPELLRFDCVIVSGVESTVTSRLSTLKKKGFPSNEIDEPWSNESLNQVHRDIHI